MNDVALNEKIARHFCAVRNVDPDGLVDASGTVVALIPQWQAWAKFLCLVFDSGPFAGQKLWFGTGEIDAAPITPATHGPGGLT